MSMLTSYFLGPGDQVTRSAVPVWLTILDRDSTPDRAYIPTGQGGDRRSTIPTFMSALFFKRFLQRPFQIASIIPSSKALVKRVARKMDFSEPRVIAEYGPGEGVHSREIARRMPPGSQLLLFELDAAFSRDLQRQFADDPRVHVINGDAARLPEELERRGIPHCDYILSGIPFSILEIKKKRALAARKRTRRSPMAAASSSTRSPTSCASMPRFSIARSRNISCRIFRRCSSRFSIR